MNCAISLLNPCTAVRDSSCVPSFVVLSLVHQTEDLALKSPKTKINKKLQEVVSLKTLKIIKFKPSWLRDLNKTPA